MPWLLVAAGVVSAATIVWFLRGRGTVALSETTVAEPALEEIAQDESEAASVSADRWRAWARELESEGRTREAIRALYLAALSHLADRGLIRLQRHKSNRDYRDELRRRARTNTALRGRFADCVATFDRVWYGRHEPSREIAGGMWRGVEEILAGAEPS